MLAQNTMKFQKLAARPCRNAVSMKEKPGMAPPVMHRICRLSTLFVLFLLLGACASQPARNPVPQESYDRAEVVDMQGVRFWGDEQSELLHDDIIRSIKDEPPGMFPRGPGGELQYAGLAISGGGDHGAFGAGYLNGWSESGTRPAFKIVTGISTGALIAPFALLGSDYDDILKKSYTTVSADEIFKKRSLVGAFYGESLADNHPLFDMVHEVITDEVIDAVGRAHLNGQRLLIGTTNFDAQRPVIWNMGAVANSVHPEAYRIFREILVASAAIPVFFPPVMVDVEVDGERYDEMHVDGGTVGQMFFYGAALDWRQLRREITGSNELNDNSVLYAIVDGEVDPDAMAVERQLGPIADRTVSTLIKVSAWSSLYRMYLHAQQGGYDFKYVNLPDSYEPEIREPYNPEEMTRMFNIGRNLGLEKAGWRSVPPGF